MVLPRWLGLLPLAALLAAGLGVPQTPTRVPFSSATYSADEDARWVVPGEAGVPGNGWYIAGPARPEDREAWLAALRAYREGIRRSVHGLSQVEIAYQGVRAWVRMRPEVAKPLDLRPGEPFRIEVEAR